jgi:hypothetical protein
MTSTTVQWDEPAGCASPRGWLLAGADCVGFYLDYGPGHYRSPHSETLNTINGPIVRVWCQPGSECRECQPGNLLAVRYPGGPGTPSASRYFETAAEARGWIETGTDG